MPDEAMMRSNYERNDRDYYPTPEWCTEALLKVQEFNYRITEPAVGDGAIANVFRRRNYHVKGFDIYDYPDTPYHTLDFFNARPEDIIGDIVTNPPFACAVEFIRHALSLASDCKCRAAFLLRNEWDSAKSRNDLFQNGNFYAKWVLLKRPRWVPYKKGDASPRHNYSWFVWDYTQSNLIPRIGWTV